MSDQADETMDAKLQAGGPPTMRSRLSLDARRALLAATFGAAAFALVDYAATLVSADGFQLSAHVILRLLFLEVGLAAAFVLPLGALALFALAAGTRLVIWTYSADAARRFPGLLGAPSTGRGGPDPATPWIGAVAAAAGLYVVLSAYLTFTFHVLFRAPELVALLLAALQLALVAACALLAYVLGRGLTRASVALAPRLGPFSPLGNRPLAVVLLTLAGCGGLWLVESMLPVRGIVPWRMIIAAGAFGAGVFVAGLLQRRGGRVFPASGPRRVRALAITASSVALVTLATLFWIGAHPTTKYVAVTSSPPVDALINLGRTLTDFNRDGYGLLLGERPPRRRADIAARPLNIGGSDLPIPEEFARDDYNFLLITIDTLRYDHTGFGGYIETSGRETTPNLDELVERSVNFDFANAPSAGTMATVPAMLTSRFFHSGIALDEDVPRGMPPRVLDSNTMLAEVMKRADYSTGAILTHYYFNDWGLDQGFDTYDNSLGRRPNPQSITSHDVTDKAITWIRQHMNDRWFLWAHYLDPHGHYMPHDMIDFGDEEKDRYDGEIFYTDYHVGRLLDELARMPGGERTVVIITSDHGEGFGEHGFINHGMALYRELIHVPLIIHVPGLPPRRVDGPVSVIDIFPTMADVAQIDISDLAIEGESLVPQLFYGEDARDRVVFAETNWPRPLRAIISADHKLIYNLQNNFYELYDLSEDPWEQRNVVDREPEAFAALRDQLDAWLERVYFNRDFEANQAMLHLQGTLLRERPSPAHPVEGVTLEGGAIELVGYDVQGAARPGEEVKVALYFAVHDDPRADYLFQAQAHLEGQRTTARSGLRITAGGNFPSSRWRAGEFVRDELVMGIPPRFAGGDTLSLALRVDARDDAEIELTGELLEGREDTIVLGELTLDEPSPAEDRAAE
jgi:choline-sulfatase